MVTTSATLFPTRPLEAHRRLDELMRGWGRNWQEGSNKRDALVILGSNAMFASLLAGLGEYYTVQLDPGIFDMLFNHPERMAPNIDAAQAHGYGPDLCNAKRLCLAALHVGSIRRFIQELNLKPSFLFGLGMCREYLKSDQIFAEHLDIPYVSVEMPLHQGPRNFDFMVEQLGEAIESMEKITGRRFDDDQFVRAVENEWAVCHDWAKICVLNRNVPAPMDGWDQIWLRLMLGGYVRKKEAAEFTREMLAEVEDRVRDGIAALGAECARLWWDGAQTFSRELVSYTHRYGAVIVNSWLLGNGAWTTEGDGSWVPARSPAERGWQLRNREDGVRALADLYVGTESDHRLHPTGCQVGSQAHGLVKRLKDWRAQGVILAQDFQCRPMFMGGLERRRTLNEHHISAVDIYPSAYNLRDFDPEKTYARLDTLMESLGLRPLDE